jgi:hypothetical protein
MITDRAHYGSPWGSRSLARFVWIKWLGGSSPVNLTVLRDANACVSDRRQRETVSGIETSVEAASCSLDAMVRITDRAHYGSPWGSRSLARFVWIKWFCVSGASEEAIESSREANSYQRVHAT